MSTLKVWFAGSILLLLASQSFAQSTLSCWYNSSGSYTGADSGEGTVGSITRTGSGDYATSYLISAFDGTACPATLPAGAIAGTTVYLVKQDFSNCTNTTVVANPSNVGGTVTMLRWPDFTTKLIVKLGDGGGSTTPNTTYHFYHKCVMLLGDITTDGAGHGGAIFNLFRVDQGAPLAFDMYPEGGPSGEQVSERHVEILTPVVLRRSISVARWFAEPVAAARWHAQLPGYRNDRLLRRSPSLRHL